jgi:hypothetical protein
MPAMTVLVHFLGFILNNWAIYTHTKVQPAALHCSLATWRMLCQEDGNSGSCMARFMCPDRA